MNGCEELILMLETKYIPTREQGIKDAERLGTREDVAYYEGQRDAAKVILRAIKRECGTGE